MGPISVTTPNPWNRTPCVLSAALSRVAGCNVFLKLETLQPSGSFKSRGIGNLMLQAVQSHGPGEPLHFYCSSGGNAGLACATAAISLNKRATIVVPNTTNELMVGKLRTLGANVYQYGASLLEADTFLRTEVMAGDPHAIYVPPFDHPDIWEGASTIIDELDEQIRQYDGIVCSVGGGGLFIGIMKGLLRNGGPRSKPVKILAMETEGADSLTQSVAAKACVTLPAITSIATSLGVRKVADMAFVLALKEEVTCMAVPDRQAAMATVKFADDERTLIEISCGASVAPVYSGALRDAMGKGMTDDEWALQRVVIIVCGGNNVTLGILDDYKKAYGGRYTKLL